MRESTETAPTDIGRNRTGIKAAPVESKKTIEGAKEAIPSELVSLDPGEIHSFRLKASINAGPVGTVPPPATVKGAAKAAVKAIQGENANVLIDQLAARLAFERSGTRLYEAVLVKFDASHPHEGGPTRSELEHIRDEELEHVALLTQCIEELGADPTAMTPSADIQSVATSGVLQVATDPRTTLSQALDALLVAELVDNDSWQLLIDLAERMGQDEMADRFQRALEVEDEHLTKVRSWLTKSLVGQAGIDPTPPSEPSPRRRHKAAESRKSTH